MTVDENHPSLTRRGGVRDGAIPRSRVGLRSGGGAKRVEGQSTSLDSPSREITARRAVRRGSENHPSLTRRGGVREVRFPRLRVGLRSWRGKTFGGACERRSVGQSTSLDSPSREKSRLGEPRDGGRKRSLAHASGRCADGAIPRSRVGLRSWRGKASGGAKHVARLSESRRITARRAVRRGRKHPSLTRRGGVRDGAIPRLRVGLRSWWGKTFGGARERRSEGPSTSLDSPSREEITARRAARR